jgi:hypothetical protein
MSGSETSPESPLEAFATTLFAQLREADRAVAEAQVHREEIMALYNQVISKLLDD